MKISLNASAESNFKPISLVELLRWRALHQPDLRAYAFLQDGEVEKASLTYQELDQQARAIGAWLLSLKAQGQRALLLYPPGLEYISAFFGCLYAQVIAVPAYPPFLNRNLARLEAIATNSQATLALTTSTILSNITRLLVAASALAKLRWVATDSLPAGIDHEWREGVEDGERIAFLQYTSGSTGTPKGVIVSHSNLLHNMAAMCERFELTTHCQGVAWQPLFHDMGLIGMVLNPLYAGFPMVLMSPLSFLQHPLRWLQAISRYKATYSGAPSFAYDLCVRKIPPAQCESLDLSRWSLAAVGAEPIREEALERFIETFGPYGFRRRAFYPCYGLAEATLIVSGGPGSPRISTKNLQKEALEQNQALEVATEDDAAQCVVGCGRALHNQKIFVVHPESLEASAPGEIGEICVAGPSVAQGYWNNSDETARTFRGLLSGSNGEVVLRTGDLGFVDKGELYITGRLKDLIIIRGLNYYPQDFEHTVQCSHPALRPGCGAAFSVEITGEERLVVVQELELDHKAEIGEIIESIRQALAERHEAQVYAVVLVKFGSIPMTSSGKIQRRECRTRFLAHSLEALGRWDDTNVSGDHQLEVTARPEESGKARKEEEIEAWLIARLSRRIGVSVSNIDVLTPFVNFGLDSAEAVSLSAELEAWLSRSLPATVAWDYPNIRSLARYLANETRNGRLDAGIGKRQQFVSEPMAIIGMGCRIPMAPHPEDYWKLLFDGVDAIREVPPERWDADAYFDPEPATPGKMNTRWGGFLEEVDQFDPYFFGISPREAARMDPQQRLLLEVAWEALENAGLAPHELAGTQAGVFIGISSNDYGRILLQDMALADVYDGTGNAQSIAANRLSYLLDLRGPSIAIDTACSSSLVALHMACQSLRSGESSLAFAGGVNLILAPEMTISLAQARIMSAVGRCKPFDASADGYVRGEGCGVVILKRLSDALADGDRILALVRGTAVNQDGRSNGLTAPHGPAQQAVIRTALENAAVAPAQIGYVEAHGAGTSLGDPIEFQALEAVLKPGRVAFGPRCAVGSVKANIGHLEAAAGVAGLIKVVLSLNHGIIPAHLHLQKLNPHISLENSPLTIPTESCAWPVGVTRRYAGVSSFSFGGTNAHVILEEAPTARERSVQTEIERPLHIVNLSARSERALKTLACRYRDYLAKNPDQSLPDLCYTANVGREHFAHRLSLRAESVAQLSERLDAFIAGARTGGSASRHTYTNHRPKVAFLFTGEGAQYTDMGRELYLTQPIFRQALNLCAEILHPHLERGLLSVLYPEPSVSAPLHEPAYTQPSLFALEYALAEMWRSWGVRPDAVLGHSVGEYVAACIAGVFSLEDGLKLIAERGRLMQALAVKGSMAVAHEGAAQVVTALADDAGRLSIAAVNGPDNTVISGPDEVISLALKKLASAGLSACRLETVSHAFHSALMDPILVDFERVASQL